jgi:hypothetical protein
MLKHFKLEFGCVSLRAELARTHTRKHTHTNTVVHTQTHTQHVRTETHSTASARTHTTCDMLGYISNISSESQPPLPPPTLLLVDILDVCACCN